VSTCSSNPSTRYGEVEFVIRNQVDDMVLKRGIFHVSKGKKNSEFSPMILPKRSASVEARASLSSAGSIECCLVYELIDQRNESKPIMGYHQVFIAVMVAAKPLINEYKASAVIFMAKNGQFTGKKEMKRLKKGILREHSFSTTYSFICAINGQTLRLKAAFDPGKRSSIEVTLEKTVEHVDNYPVLY
jgi:hypothetical protein